MGWLVTLTIYTAAAFSFYWLVAKGAVRQEETERTHPAPGEKPVLEVIEGGQSDERKAA